MIGEDAKKENAWAIVAAAAVRSTGDVEEDSIPGWRGVAGVPSTTGASSLADVFRIRASRDIRAMKWSTCMRTDGLFRAMRVGAA
nr:putative integron gene cassette protein [uncultured bacterium]